MYRFGSAVFVAVFLFAGSAFAASNPDITSGPKTSTRTLNVTGIGAAAGGGFVDNANGGACNVDPWVDQCSSTAPGTCSCIEITVSKASGSMEKGTQTVSNLFITADENVNPATEPTVTPGPDPKCSLFRGILTDTVSSTSETKTLNLLGVSCKKVIGISASNPQGNHVGDTIVGGWGISSSPSDPTPPASGWGTLSGSDVKTTGAVSLKLSGLVTQ